MDVNEACGSQRRRHLTEGWRAVEEDPVKFGQRSAFGRRKRTLAHKGILHVEDAAWAQQTRHLAQQPQPILGVAR